MKTLVLLAVVLALCVPAFGGPDPNALAVLVYKVKADVKVAEYTDDNYTDAELGKGTVDGYVVARFEKADLDTYVGDVNDEPIFILVDKKAKEYVVISEADDYQQVEFAFDDKNGDPIFNVLNSKGQDTKKDYIVSYLYVHVDDPNTEDAIFTLDVWHGLTQITSSVIDNANTKILVPKNIKYNSGEVSVDMNLAYSYKVNSSATLDTKYTKSANGAGLKVQGAAVLIVADLIDKQYTAVTAKEFFTWDVAP